MNFQSIILAAGTLESQQTGFKKCRFPVDSSTSLLELSMSTHKSSQKVVIALNPDDYDFFSKKELVGNSQLVSISHATQGALATSGMCLDLIDDDLPVLISAVDGLCFNITEKFLAQMEVSGADGGVIVFPSEKLNYSYVRVSSSVPIEFAEKVRIGELATAGIYFFRSKKLLVDSILWAILNQIKYNNTYYLSSAMNKLIFENRKVVLFETDEENYFRFSSKEEAVHSLSRMEDKSLG